jgi:hypothetical protein
MNPEKPIHIFVETPDNHRRELTFHQPDVRGKQIKDAADVPLTDELALVRDGRLQPIANDESIELKAGANFIVLVHQIRVIVEYIAASKPFKIAVEPTTTVGTIKAEALDAFGLKEDKTKGYKLFHNRTELVDLNQQIGQVAGHHKEVKLELEEYLIQGM